MTQSKREVAQTVADALRAGGMSDNMIAGVLANIADESSFNPESCTSHDQPPRFGGPKRSSRMVCYQEGGTNGITMRRGSTRTIPAATGATERCRAIPRRAAEDGLSGHVEEDDGGEESG